MMLEDLFIIQNRLIANISLDFSRYLYDQINWSNRLIIIKGARGVGKTTLVLQHYLKQYNDFKKCLYISADNPIVLKNGIYLTASEYFKYYGDCVIIDEVHKQNNWSVEIKALYDAYPDKKLIVLGSSTLNILFEKGDLSRRAIIYSLQPLSFREYLNLTYKKSIPSYSFPDILSRHVDISVLLVSEFKTILADFINFQQVGSFPFFISHDSQDYFNILLNVMDKVIYEDISTLRSIRAFSSIKLKTLLGYIATSKIPLFNIESLKRELEVSKDTLYEYFKLLENADLVSIVRTSSKKPNVFKNSKILFKSPNLYYAVAYDLWKNDPEKGNIRESFFSSQIEDKYLVNSSLKTDFVVHCNRQEYEIEVGGQSKTKKQIKNLENAFIFKDGIEIGHENIIPLYLAGFLY